MEIEQKINKLRTAILSPGQDSLNPHQVANSGLGSLVTRTEPERRESSLNSILIHIEPLTIDDFGGFEGLREAALGLISQLKKELGMKEWEKCFKGESTRRAVEVYEREHNNV